MTHPHRSEHFFYSLLRYHDVRREESLIIGGLLLFPGQRVLRFMSPEHLDRLIVAFPDCPVQTIRAYFAAFHSLANTLVDQIEILPSSISTFREFIADRFLAEDGSALQFAEPRMAALIMNTPDKVIQNFYHRYLQTYERAVLAA